jgi:hypothetical protein
MPVALPVWYDSDSDFAWFGCMIWLRLILYMPLAVWLGLCMSEYQWLWRRDNTAVHAHGSAGCLDSDLGLVSDSDSDSDFMLTSAWSCRHGILWAHCAVTQTQTLCFCVNVCMVICKYPDQGCWLAYIHTCIHTHICYTFVYVIFART